MKRLLTTLTATLAMLLLAAPAAAQERGDTCEDPAADPSTFICGQITVTLTRDTEDGIEDVIDRVAADADIEVFMTPTEPGTTYGLNVPVGEEWDWVEAFRSDEAVEVAHLIQVGQHTDPTPSPASGGSVPDTAMAAPSGTAGLIAAVTLLAMIGWALAWTLRLGRVR